MPTVTLSVSPTSITAGQSATLMWSSSQATSCTASGAWSGSQATMGSQAVTPTTSGSVTYTLTCTGANGGSYGGGGGPTGTQTTTLTVNPATAFVVKALVADGPGVAVTQDQNLVNAWGLVFGANAPVWISNNGTNTSSLYDGNGTNEKLLVALPANTGGTPFQPTGIVSFDPTNFPNDFVVTAAGKSGPSSFIYSGLDGQIAGWSATVDLTHAVSAYTANDKACYRGLAIANNGTANFLYANDFVGGKIDVFDAKFTKQSSTAFPFTDAKLPPNYAPFGIQAIANGPNGYGGWGGNLPLQNLVDDYETMDGKAITDPTSVYDPQKPYVNRDPRFYATILYNGATYRGSTVEIFTPGGKDSKDGPDNWNTSKTGYYLKKFMNDNYPLQNPWGNAGFQFATGNRLSQDSRFHQNGKSNDGWVPPARGTMVQPPAQ